MTLNLENNENVYNNKKKWIGR